MYALSVIQIVFCKTYGRVCAWVRIIYDLKDLDLVHSQGRREPIHREHLALHWL